MVDLPLDASYVLFEHLLSSGIIVSKPEVEFVNWREDDTSMDLMATLSLPSQCSPSCAQRTLILSDMVGGACGRGLTIPMDYLQAHHSFWKIYEDMTLRCHYLHSSVYPQFRGYSVYPGISEAQMENENEVLKNIGTRIFQLDDK